MVFGDSRSSLSPAGPKDSSQDLFFQGEHVLVELDLLGRSSPDGLKPWALSSGESGQLFRVIASHHLAQLIEWDLKPPTDVEHLLASDADQDGVQVTVTVTSRMEGH